MHGTSSGMHSCEDLGLCKYEGAGLGCCGAGGAKGPMALWDEQMIWEGTGCRGWACGHSTNAPAPASGLNALFHFLRLRGIISASRWALCLSHLAHLAED